MSNLASTNDMMSRIIENVRSVIGIAGAITGLCYVIGFIIVNIYLGRFGVHDLTLIKPQYFAAGLLYLALSASIAVVPIVNYSLLRELRERGIVVKRRHVVSLLIASLFIVATIVWLAGIVLIGAEPAQVSVLPIMTRRIFIWIALPVSQIILWSPIVFGWGIISLLRRRVRDKNVATPNQVLATLLTPLQTAVVALIEIAALVSFFIFSIWVFPHVSAILGGAAPIHVRLLLSDEGVASVRSLPITLQDGSTERLVLIDQSADHVLLLYGNSQILQLSSNVITGILYNAP